MKKKKVRNIIIGIILIAGSLFGMTKQVDTIWHYFGNGTLFGIGISLAVSAAYRLISSKNKG